MQVVGASIGASRSSGCGPPLSQFNDQERNSVEARKQSITGIEARATWHLNQRRWRALRDAQFRQQTIQRVVVNVEVISDLLDGLQELRVVQGGLDRLGNRWAAEHVLQGTVDRRGVERAGVEEAQAAHDRAGGTR